MMIREKGFLGEAYDRAVKLLESLNRVTVYGGLDKSEMRIVRLALACLRELLEVLGDKHGRRCFA